MVEVVLRRAPIRSGKIALTLGLALGLTLGCRGEGRELGNFEDEVGDTGNAPPDLPKLECLPRSSGFAGECESDEKCRYLVDAEFGPTGHCVPVISEGVAGEPCTVEGETDTCRAGAVCWAIDLETGVGVCMDYCTAFLTCEDPDKVCLVGEDGLLALCLDPCLPTEPEACPPGWGCYDSPAGRWGCDRDYSGEGGAHGSPCDCVNCCDPGLICQQIGLVDAPDCVDSGALGCCTEVCELADGTQEGEPEPICPSSENETCRPYYGEQVLAGYERVGVCRL